MSKSKSSWSLWAGGSFLGTYDAQTARGAITRYCKCMGYRSIAHAAGTIGQTAGEFIADLRAVEVAS
jgi:hypothetical protein